ncbi:MAG: L-threonylcarbamoyladenylate synthase [Oscillospiraceae bacterium]|nr:L-threonylcarbamoyladenylate synthase [Oscillospiraceae bacterium]
METKFVSIEEAAALLRAGAVVAFPTETVYGLGADATSDAAIAQIFASKGRPGDNPLIVHIGDLAWLSSVVSACSDTAQRLMDAFWPGPLTVILPKHENLAERVTAGLSTVGVRMPSHSVALELLRAVELPIAAPSANVSGRPSPTRAVHVADDLDGRIAGIVDGGAAEIGLESTVIDCTVEPPVILRPGAVTRAEIEAVIGPVDVAEVRTDDVAAPKSPGMKYRHYAPKAPMTIVQGSEAFFRQVVAEARCAGKRVGVLVAEEHAHCCDADVVLTCGSGQAAVARRLYDVLREFDSADVDVIYSESFSEVGIGEAIMNRLRKASGGRVIAE